MLYSISKTKRQQQQQLQQEKQYTKIAISDRSSLEEFNEKNERERERIENFTANTAHVNINHQPSDQM